ncbi:hypothetical protein EC988_005680, partial [Linderina pennispora]
EASSSHGSPVQRLSHSMAHGLRRALMPLKHLGAQSMPSSPHTKLTTASQPVTPIPVTASSTESSMSPDTTHEEQWSEQGALAVAMAEKRRLPPPLPTEALAVQGMIDGLMELPDRVDCGLVDVSQMRRRLGVGPKRREECQVYYEVFGSGPRRLLLLMGMLGSTMFWRLQTRYFAHLGDYTVCVFDNRGSGRTTLASGPYRITQMARDAMQVMEHLGWHDSVHLVGVSMGGMIAQELCLMNDREDRYASVALVDTWHSASMALPTAKEVKFAFNGMAALGSDPGHLIDLVFSRDWAQAPFRDPLGSEAVGCGLTNRQMLRTLFARIESDLAEYRTASPPKTAHATTSVSTESPEPPRFPHTQSSPIIGTVQMTQHGTQSTPGTDQKRETSGDLHQFMACLGHRLTPARVRRIQTQNPTTRFLVIHGRKDRVIRPVCGRTLAKLLGCPLVWLEGAGHMPLIDAHCSFNLVVRAFTRHEPWLDELPDRTRIAPAPWHEQVRVREWMGKPVGEIALEGMEQVRLACRSPPTSPGPRKSTVDRIEPVGELAQELILVDDRDLAHDSKI